jgi:tagaturonate reductase
MELLKRTNQKKHTERVLQFGEGNFLRGFADWMFDNLNKENGGDYGVVVVQPRPSGNIKRLNDQDGLYTLRLRGLKNGAPTEETEIIDCITRAVNPYEDIDAFFECAKNPNLRYIVSNTTEAGIEYKSGQTDGDFINSTFPARLTMFLKARFDAGMDGFLILPCELIDNNGDALKECIQRYASDLEYGGDFIKWLNEKNCFFNTLVDRIVTGYPKDDAEKYEKEFGYADALTDTGEIFHLWVIEGDKKYAQELPFHEIGLNVLWTDDVTPYKERKVRILNGAHTMTSLAAHLAGLETVHDAMEDEEIYEFAKKGIYDEIIPTLNLPHGELCGFADDVIERFKNPFIKHYLLSIALNSISKFKVRVLPSIKEYIKRYGNEPKCLIFSLAALIVFYRTPAANDNAEVVEFMKTAKPCEILKHADYWGEDLSYLLPTVEEYVRSIEEKGIRKAMREVI